MPDDHMPESITPPRVHVPFYQVVREYHSDGEQRHEMFFFTSNEASEWIATDTVGAEASSLSIADYVIYVCACGEPRKEILRVKGRS